MERRFLVRSRSRVLGFVQGRRVGARAVGGCLHDVGVLGGEPAREEAVSGEVVGGLVLVPDRKWIC